MDLWTTDRTSSEGRPPSQWIISTELLNSRSLTIINSNKRCLAHLTVTRAVYLLNYQILIITLVEREEPLWEATSAKAWLDSEASDRLMCKLKCSETQANTQPRAPAWKSMRTLRTETNVSDHRWKTVSTIHISNLFLFSPLHRGPAGKRQNSRPVCYLRWPRWTPSVRPFARKISYWTSKCYHKNALRFA